MAYLFKRLLWGSLLLAGVISFQYLRMAAPALDEALLETANPEAGEQLLVLAGCVACHSPKDQAEAAMMSGGDAIETPYGTFFPPNITPDKQRGIGQWTLEDFNQALRGGRNPKGKPYYAVFPYTAYSGLADQDVVNMWAAIQSMPVSAQVSEPHQLVWPFAFRPLMVVWQALFFEPIQAPKTAPVSGSERGAYLTQSVLHCAECHTPRNWLGALDQRKALSGAYLGGNDKHWAPDIRTPVLLADGWTEEDLGFLLYLGMLPWGDFVGAYMSDVTDAAEVASSASDRAAIAQYLLNPSGH